MNGNDEHFEINCEGGFILVNRCKCSGELDIKEIKAGKFKGYNCLEFVFICRKCGQTVIHSRIPTRHGYVTLQVQNLGIVSA